MGEHNLTLQRIIFIWIKYLNCPEQAVSIRRLKSSLPVSNPLVPHDHHRQWSWSPCLSPYRLYSWYSFITFFFLSLSSSNLLLSPFLLCCVSCVSLPLLFPSFPLPCCGVLWLSLFHWGGWHPYSYPYLPRSSRGGHSAKAPRPVEGVWFRHRGGPTAHFPSRGALGWLGRHVPWVWQVA